MKNEQAYTTFGSLPNATSEFNRLNFLVRSIMAQQATTTLVIVRSVSAGAVSVQPMVSQVDGAGNAVEHGVIHDLPVWRLQGGNSAVIVEPAVGDIGVALFASTDISNVKRSKAPATPGSFRRFDWSDGIYLGGLLNAEPTQFVRMDDEGVTITSPVSVTINSDGPVEINGSNLTVSSDVHITGNLLVDGTITGGTL